MNIGTNTSSKYISKYLIGLSCFITISCFLQNMYLLYVRQGLLTFNYTKDLHNFHVKLCTRHLTKYVDHKNKNKIINGQNFSTIFINFGVYNTTQLWHKTDRLNNFSQFNFLRKPNMMFPSTHFIIVIILKDFFFNFHVVN